MTSRTYTESKTWSATRILVMYLWSQPPAHMGLRSTLKQLCSWYSKAQMRMGQLKNPSPSALNSMEYPYTKHLKIYQSLPARSCKQDLRLLPDLSVSLSFSVLASSVYQRSLQESPPSVPTLLLQTFVPTWCVMRVWKNKIRALRSKVQSIKPITLKSFASSQTSRG